MTTGLTYFFGRDLSLHMGGEIGPTRVIDADRADVLTDVRGHESRTQNRNPDAFWPEVEVEALSDSHHGELGTNVGDVVVAVRVQTGDRAGVDQPPIALLDENGDECADTSNLPRIG